MIGSCTLYKGIVQDQTVVLYATSRGKTGEAKIEALVDGQRRHILGIPTACSIHDPHELRKISLFLQRDCSIKIDPFSIAIFPKLRGGRPPFETELFDQPQNPEISPLEQSFLEQAISSVATLVPGSPLLKFGVSLITGGIVRVINKLSNAAKIADLNQRITQLSGDMEKGGVATKQALDTLTGLIDGLVANDKDRDAVVGEMNALLNEKIGDIRKKPPDANRQLELGAMMDLVSLVAHTITDKETAYRVQKVGEATVSFAEAWNIGKSVVLTTAASALPFVPVVGNLLAGALAIYSLFSRQTAQEPFQVLENQIKELSTQIGQIEQTFAIRFDRLEGIISSSSLMMLQQFAGLSGQINALKLTSISQYQAVNQKLDQIFNYISLGLPALALLNLSTLASTAHFKVQAGQLTDADHLDLIMGFWQWATLHSKNDLFTGALNSNYSSSSVVSMLSSRGVEKSINYLANHPLVGGGYQLANPFVWAESVREYLKLRLKTKSFDRLYGATHLPLFKQILAEGQKIQDFIKTIQTNKNLHDTLNNRYLSKLNALSFLSVQDLEEAIKPSTTDPAAVDLEANSLLIQAFSELAFNRSYALDPFFSAFFKRTGKQQFKIVTLDQMRDELASIKSKPPQQQPYLLRTYFEDLKLSATVYKEVIKQKLLSSDPYSVVENLMRFLKIFGNRCYPTDAQFTLQNQPNASPPHFTDISQILNQNIFFAIKVGDLSSLKKLLPLHLHDRDGVGRTPLHYACAEGNLDMVRLLVESGANMDLPDVGQSNPLHLVKGVNSAAISTYMLQKGAVPPMPLQKGPAAPSFERVPPQIHPPQRTISLKWIQRSLDMNNPAHHSIYSHLNVNYQLGICSYFGNDTKVDYKEAATYFKLAADEGVPEAQYCMAICHILGHGVRKNRQEAYRYICKAASKEGSKQLPMADLVKRQIEQFQF